MVLSLKRWKSRSSPGIEAGGYKHTKLENPSTCHLVQPDTNTPAYTRGRCRLQRPYPHRSTTSMHHVAGWSSPVARQAHNLKVTGSNPVPATNTQTTTPPQDPPRRFFCALTPVQGASRRPIQIPGRPKTSVCSREYLLEGPPGTTAGLPHGPAVILAVARQGKGGAIGQGRDRCSTRVCRRHHPRARAACLAWPRPEHPRQDGR